MLNYKKMEIICIDDNFEPEKLEYFKHYNIILPKEGKLYTIRKIVNHASGVKGLLLNEIINRAIPTSIVVIGNVEIEPTWHLKRFSTLNGDKISIEEYVEMEK